MRNERYEQPALLWIELNTRDIMSDSQNKPGVDLPDMEF